MRVYYISSGLQGCYVARCLMPLTANGWDGDQTSISLDSKTPENKSLAAQNADVVVFHRPDDPRKLELAKLLKQQGKKIVFDNDDTYREDSVVKLNEFLDNELYRVRFDEKNKVINEFIKMADLVTCSTECLAEEYREISPDNVVVLPNCIDPFYFEEPLRNEGDKVRIGVVGSIGVTDDLWEFEKIIPPLLNRDDIELVFFSLGEKGINKMVDEIYDEEYKFLDKLQKANNVIWQPFVDMQDYYDTLNELRLDIMLIPRADNYFNRCKSNLKFLEASMFEIPVIAQGFKDGKSPYQVNPEDAKHMIIVDDNWQEAIEKLVKDKELRREMGRKAREYVINNYDIEKNAHKWEEAYQSMFKRV